MIKIIKIENGQPVGQSFNLPTNAGKYNNITLAQYSEMTNCVHTEFIVPEEYNSNTHKEGNFIQVGDAWTYKVVELIPEELQDIANNKWQNDMALSDIKMTRDIEDIWDVIGISKAPQVVQDNHAAKKLLRSKKP